MVKEVSDTEDLLQEIFVKAYFALPKFNQDSTFYTWIYRIAANHCLDHLRKHRPKTYSLDEQKDDGEDTFQPMELKAPFQEAPHETIDFKHTLRAVLSELSPEHRLVLTLRELQGYNYEEIAEIAECEVNTVKSRLNRARAAFKEIFEMKMGTSDAKNPSNPLRETI